MKKNVNLYYYNKEPNFGDMLNPFLLNLMGDFEINFIEKDSQKDIITAIGSILHHFENVEGGTVSVWGTGVMHTSFKIDRNLDFFAVRGKLTKMYLENLGYKIPSIFGDPALLVSSYYYPRIKKENKIIVIPHMSDRTNIILDSWKKYENVRIINVFDTPESIIKEILSANLVLSSSLHGLIVPISYDIPTVWIDFGGLIKGGYFKFFDFYSIFNIKVEPIKILNQNIRPEELAKYSKRFNIDKIIKDLIKVRPF